MQPASNTAPWLFNYRRSCLGEKAYANSATPSARRAFITFGGRCPVRTSIYGTAASDSRQRRCSASRTHLEEILFSLFLARERGKRRLLNHAPNSILHASRPTTSPREQASPRSALRHRQTRPARFKRRAGHRTTGSSPSFDRTQEARPEKRPDRCTRTTRWERRPSEDSLPATLAHRQHARVAHRTRMQSTKGYPRVSHGANAAAACGETPELWARAPHATSAISSREAEELSSAHEPTKLQ